MPDDVKPSPEVIERKSFDPPTPPAPDPDETRARAYLREKYGIDDDPETWTLKQKQLREAAEAIPRYEQALTISRQLLEQVAAQSEPAAPAPQEPAADLGAVLTKIATGLDERQAQRFQAHETSKQLLDRTYQAWPEAQDPTSELFKTGLAIFQYEMTDYEKNLPSAFYAATERAAGRLGLAPAFRRTSPAREDAPAQSIQRGGAKRPAEEPDVKLTPREMKMAQEMEISPKAFAAAKAQRLAGKNVEVR